MNRNLKIYLTFIGLTGLLFSCKKDETKVVLSANPALPTIITVPDLTLKRANGKDTLLFTGSAVDPGFQASANYFLEVCAAGNAFKVSSVLISDIQDAKLKITVSDLNTILLQMFPADKVTSADLRIRTILVADAGTGANPIVYYSAVKTVNITPYGLPRLDLVNSGTTQKVESPLGDGKYSSFVKLIANQAFTLKDPDANIVYGGSAEVLSVNGAGISGNTSGWYQFVVDTKALTYKLALCNMGVIGDATPNGWNAPDTKMDFDPSSQAWFVTLNLTTGTFKFRSNDNWDGKPFNLGIGTGYSVDNLMNGGSSANIPITAAGNYTIKLYINKVPYKCTITKNN
jgi:hypothetical protein